ncbi:MAG: ABC transporter ATP-binding protein [Bdellovibrionales bacterium]|nr:ABC transporter ATP-binding protein [Bdellovibrionales bacterium]
MIEVRGLTKSYGERLAIQDINFTVKKGEVVGFLGPNGAGKSTTMKIITGYMAPSNGTVLVDGYDVFESPLEVKKRIGYLPETPPVYMDMIVKDYLTFVAKLHGKPSVEAKSLSDLAMEKTSLTEVSRRLIGNLSKGYRQRVGLAQALVSDPEVLILDEPTVGLDPKQVHEMRELIQKLKGQHTIVLSTHILPEVQATCDRLIIISRGKIVAEDSLEGLGKRLSASGQVLLKIRRGAEELISSMVRDVPGVLSVRKNGSYLEASVDHSEDTIEAIANYTIKKNAGLLELKSVDLDLEQIFIRLTSAEKNH